MGTKSRWPAARLLPQTFSSGCASPVGTFNNLAVEEERAIGK